MLNHVVNLSFGRALNAKEKKDYIACTKRAKQQLGIKDTTVILFDYMVPVETDKNIGIGTTFSANAQKFVKFLKDMCAISSIQINPQGILKDDTISPYSSDTLAIGEHIIDLFQLSDSEFSKILPIKSLKKYLLTENPNESQLVNYEKLVRQDYKKSPNNFVFSKLLREAYINFKNLKKSDKLIREFNKFCKENKDWLDNESLYFAISEKYKSTQWQCWRKYQNLFLNGHNGILPQELNELSNEKEYFKFIQFCAYKQQNSAHNKFLKNGIKIYGDIPISFSPSQQWINKEIFSNNYTFGYYYNGNYSDWGSPAPDMDKFQDPKYKEKIKDIFKMRLRTALKKYDAVRIDAAWELVNPCLIKWSPQKLDGKMLHDFGLDILKAHEEIAEKMNKNKDGDKNLYFELLGDEDILKTLAHVKNKYPCTLITNNIIENLRTVKSFFEEGFKDGYFTVGIGTHDNESLIELSDKLFSQDVNIKNNIEKNIEILSNSIKIPKDKLFTKEGVCLAKFAELFTAKRQFLNVFDILGSNKVINRWDTTLPDNWRNRIPINYEHIYHVALQNNMGLNLPEVLRTALIIKGTNDNKLLSELDKFAKILKLKGATTEKEINSSQHINS